MGLLRKIAYLGSGGIVGPRSKRERDQIRMIAAIQGKSAAEIRRAGGRYDFEGFLASGGITDTTGKERPVLQEPQKAGAPPVAGPAVLHEVAIGIASLDGGPVSYQAARSLDIADDDLVSAVAKTQWVLEVAKMRAGSASGIATMAVTGARVGLTMREIMTREPGLGEHVGHSRHADSDPVIQALREKSHYLGKGSSGEWLDLSRDEYLAKLIENSTAQQARCAYLDAREAADRSQQ